MKVQKLDIVVWLAVSLLLGASGLALDQQFEHDWLVVLGSCLLVLTTLFIHLVHRMCSEIDRGRPYRPGKLLLAMPLVVLVIVSFEVVLQLSIHSGGWLAILSLPISGLLVKLNIHWAMN